MGMRSGIGIGASADRCAYRGIGSSFTTAAPADDADHPHLGRGSRDKKGIQWDNSISKYLFVW